MMQALSSMIKVAFHHNPLGNGNNPNPSKNAVNPFGLTQSSGNSCHDEAWWGLLPLPYAVLFFVFNKNRHIIALKRRSKAQNRGKQEKRGEFLIFFGLYDKINKICFSGRRTLS